MTHQDNIAAVAKDGLCIGCGVCKAVCPGKCIDYALTDGMYQPRVDEKHCLHCGQCLAVCPGRGCDYASLYRELGMDMPSNMYVGHCLDAFTAVARDPGLLQEATSGGVVTALTRHLLRQGIYDCAFLVDGHQCNGPLSTTRKTSGDDLLTTCKSRYVPVQQTEAIAHLLSHPEDRIIFVGVPCFVQSLLRTMRQRQVDRSRHLIIGLFCASAMNYNIWNYLADRASLPVDCVDALHFRSKHAGKDKKLCRRWPGDVHIIDKNGASHLLSRNVRTDAKAYFTPLRCLYCLDKLNQFADVSTGDNYTGKHAHEMGSSSVIVRTRRGMVVRNEQLFQIFPESIQSICEGQKLTGKERNLCYQRFASSSLLHRNDEMPLPQDWEKRRPQYERAKAALALGAGGDMTAVNEAIRQEKLEKKNHKSFWQRLLRLVFRGGGRER